MASICDSLLAADIQPACENPLVRGFEVDGVIIPRADIDFTASTINSSNPNIISSLVIKSGKRGFHCEQMGATPFSGSTQSLSVGTYQNTWDSSVQLLVPTYGPVTARDIVDALTNGDNVVILRNKVKSDGLDTADRSAEYQVFGWWQGMRASAGERDPYSDDTLGGVLMTLTETGSPKSAMFLYGSSKAATDTMYNSLTNVAQ